MAGKKGGSGRAQANLAKYYQRSAKAITKARRASENKGSGGRSSSVQPLASRRPGVHSGVQVKPKGIPVPKGGMGSRTEPNTTKQRMMGSGSPHPSMGGKPMATMHTSTSSHKGMGVPASMPMMATAKPVAIAKVATAKVAPKPKPRPASASSRQQR